MLLSDVLFALVLVFLQQDTATLSSQGAAAMRAQRYEEAAGVYRKLAAQDAANPMWRMNLGMALAYAGDHREASAALSAFLRARPQPGPAHLFLGLSLLKLNQPCDAIAPLETALRRWPPHPPTTAVELGDAYYGCKRWESAAKAYAEAADGAKPQARIAHCWWLARKYEQAKAAYLAVPAQKLSEDAELLYEYGDTLMRLEGAAAGLPWLQKSVARAADLAPAHGVLGRALLELDRPADAAPHLEIASKQDAALLLPLSKAYRSLGRIEDAARVEGLYKVRMQ